MIGLLGASVLTICAFEFTCVLERRASLQGDLRRLLAHFREGRGGWWSSLNSKTYATYASRDTPGGPAQGAFPRVPDARPQDGQVVVHVDVTHY